MQTARNRLTIVLATAVAKVLATPLWLGAQFAVPQHGAASNIGTSTIPSIVSHQGQVLAR